MKIPPPDLVYVSQEVDRLGRELLDSWRDAGSPGDSPPPGEMLRAAQDLFDALHGHAEPVPTPETTKELRALGEHGLHLLQALAEQAQAMGLAGPSSALRHLSFPLALWLARRGAEFGTLEPVADAVAELANRLNTPRDLAELYPLLGELVEATAAGGDSGDRPPRRAWRVLVLNRAIVATRSHRPPLMEDAFNAVAELLPDDAAAFFQEAMEQMDIVGYPSHVREVVERHYRRHCTNRVLH